MRCIITRADQSSKGEVPLEEQPPEYEVVYRTHDPFGGPFSPWGPDVCEKQSVAVRFSVNFDCYLKRLGLWFMNNGSPGVPEVTVTLRNDKSNENGSIPGNEIYETWTFKVSAVGWNPVREEFSSLKTPYLEKGVKYWIIAESDAVGGEDGDWVMAAIGTGFSTVNSGSGSPWQPGNEGAVPATIVWAIPPVK
jgi:hypothetical protein